MPFHTPAKGLDDMTPAERIQAVKDLDLAATQYRKQITEKFITYISMEVNRKHKSDFVITAKKGILNTMSPKSLDKFIKRLDRMATIGEDLGYKVNFNKWRDTGEYAWFFHTEDK